MKTMFLDIVMYIFGILLFTGYSKQDGFSNISYKLTCKTAEQRCPQDDRIQFWLYNRNNIDGIQITSEKINDAPFITEGPIKFIVHGTHTNIKVNDTELNRNKSPFKQIRPYYLQYGDYNVISVDWGYFAIQEKGCSDEFKHSLIIVGNCTADIIEAICKRKELNCDSIHVIGHSAGILGVSVTAKFSKSKYNRVLTRITVLEPAQFARRLVVGDYAIDKNDAKQVDVAHTNAGRVGLVDELGTVDFYFNGGSKQPGCNVTEDRCNHLRSVDYFGESIIPLNISKGFWGYKCSLSSYKANQCPEGKNESEFVLWGENLPTGIQGTFMIDTGYTFPFANGKSQERIEEQ